MKQLFLITLILVGTISFAQVSPDRITSKNDKAIKYYNLGIAADEEGNYKLAIEHYHKALRLDRSFTFAWDNLGGVYLDSGQYHKAVEAFKKSIKIDNKRKTPLLNIGFAYKLQKKNDQAIRCFNNYIKTFKEDPEGYYEIGRVYSLELNFELVIVNMIKAFKLYEKTNSPDIKDAKNYLEKTYSVMNELNMLDLFRKVANENNFNIEKKLQLK